MVGGGFKLLLHKCDKVILWGGKLAVEWKWSGKRKNPLFGRIGVYNLCLNHASSPLHWRQILGQSGQTDLTLTRCLSKTSTSHIMNEIIGKFGKQSWTSEGTFQCRFTQSLHFPEHHHDVNLEFFATPMFMRNLRHFSHDEPPASNPQICSSIPLCSFTWIWYKTCSDCEKLCHPIQCENNQTNMREKIMNLRTRKDREWWSWSQAM